MEYVIKIVEGYGWSGVSPEPPCEGARIVSVTTLLCDPYDERVSSCSYILAITWEFESPKVES